MNGVKFLARLMGCGALLLFFSVPARSQSEGGALAVVPVVGLNGDEGSSVGLELGWLKMMSTNWDLRASGFYGYRYQQSSLGVQLMNKKLLDFLYVSFEGGYVFSQRRLFHGLGNMTSLLDPTQYSILSHRAEGKVGVRVLDSLILGVSGAWVHTEVGSGNREDHPQLVNFYTSDRLRRGTALRPLGAFLIYDDQDSDAAPLRGSELLFLYEKNQQTGDEPEYTRVFTTAKHTLPLVDSELVSVFRIHHERVWGGDMPFFGRAKLGGPTNLRSFSRGRFTDFSSILYGVEPRWVFWRPGDYFERMELSTGVEAGRVFSDGTITTLYDQLHVSWVGGLTFVLKSGIPLRLDVAAGPEGTLGYLHLFYPF
jgi:hypothetical protein